MKYSCVLFALCFCLAIFGTQAQESSSTDVTDRSDSPSTEVTTTLASTTEASTTEEPSSVAPTTISTETTQKPTEPPVTTQPPPTTAAPQTATTWMVNGSDTVCIVATMAVTFDIQYNNTAGNMTVKTLELPANAIVDPRSECYDNDNNSQILELGFREDSCRLTFNFTQQDHKVSVVSLVLNIALKQIFPDAQDENAQFDFTSAGPLFTVATGHSFFCASGTNVEDVGSKINFKSLKMEAFRKKRGDTKFSLAEDCNNDVSNIVPIAVGCALAAMVVIVLIAYLVGRRHKRQKGYESGNL